MSKNNYGICNATLTKFSQMFTEEEVQQMIAKRQAEIDAKSTYEVGDIICVPVHGHRLQEWHQITDVGEDDGNFVLKMVNSYYAGKHPTRPNSELYMVKPDSFVTSKCKIVKLSQYENIVKWDGQPY
jgi:hypothetical protein